MRTATKVLFYGLIVALLIVLVGILVLIFGRIDRKVEATGMLLPAEIADVTPELSGIIDTVFVNEGERIREGDTLLTIHSEELKYRLEQAGHSLAEAKASLKRAREEYQNITSSRSYEIGMVLADLNEAEESLEYARKNYLRSRDLYEKGFIDQQDFEQSELNYQSRKSYLKVIESRIDILKKQYQRRIRQGEINIDLARRAYRLASRNLDKSVVTAPAGGTIITRDPGKLSGRKAVAGEPLLSIGDLEKLSFVCNLNEMDMAKTRVGQGARIFMNSYPYRQYRIFEGQVTGIAPIPTIAEDRVTFEVKVSIPDPWVEDEGERVRLRYGMRGRVEIITEPDIRIARALLQNVLD
ncbi:MAG: HlyD family efflux transporter periplasmic adaptor subunit [Candidatus Latescibacteria bacterium]|nr:HlyD family efflux transporter periplasmic adaptor subunit [bacterium]MBD3423067.1 HlyD family efflux transporter periplasmic adaptor subunit [Candidatus Latescibacterota bacterium]